MDVNRQECQLDWNDIGYPLAEEYIAVLNGTPGLGFLRRIRRNYHMKTSIGVRKRDDHRRQKLGGVETDAAALRA